MLKVFMSIAVGVVTVACPLGGSYSIEGGSETATGNSSEVQIAIAYAIEDLPVWRLDKGQPVFDPTILIAILRNHVEPTAVIGPSVDNKAIVVVAPKTAHDVVRRVLSPLWAFSGNSSDRLQRRIADAKISNQNVLLLAADPNSAAVKWFFDFKLSNDDLPLQEMLSNFVIQCVPSQEVDLLKGLGVTEPRGQGAVIAILDHDGELLSQVTFADLETSNQGPEMSLTEFLASHRPTEFADARSSLSSGCDQARREQKRVLLLLSGPNCVPCRQLTRFLVAQRELISKDYVHVELDTRMPHVSAVIEGIRAEAQGPVPWMAILAADGEVLATSDGPDGNIGYPLTKQSKDHFQRMLSTTSQRLTADELSVIIDGLGPTIGVGTAPASGTLK